MLLTRAPLDPKISFDLHVLSMPPAFVLSQDQTLKLNGLINNNKIYIFLHKILVTSTCINTCELAWIHKQIVVVSDDKTPPSMNPFRLLTISNSFNHLSINIKLKNNLKC